MSQVQDQGGGTDPTVLVSESVCQTVERLGAVLLKKGWRLVLAEPCTGGGVAAAVTEVPGASAWFECGYVVYANSAKQRDLGVSGELIESNGAVSDAVVRAMVTGLLARTQGDIGAAISGVAGPDGGSKDKPVGTVYFGFALKSGRLETEHKHFKGDRQQVRLQAVDYCLHRLVSLTEQSA